MENHPVETAHLPRNPFGSESLGAVELIREPDAGYRNGNGGKHQKIFCWRRLLNCLCFCFQPYARHNGLEKFLELVAAKKSWQTNPSTNNGEHGENDQGNGHCLRRFVNVALSMIVGACVSKKCKEHQAKHVKRGHTCGS